MEQSNRSIFARISTGIKVLFALYSLIYAFRPLIDPIANRNIHLLFALVIVFLPKESDKKIWKKLLNAACAIAAIIVGLYIQFQITALYERQGRFTALDYYLGVLLLALVFIATWKKYGATLPIIVAVFIVYAVFSKYLPGILYHPGYKFRRVLLSNTMNFTGTHGDLLGTSATIIIIFLIFGSFLLTSGASEFFIKLAHSLVWRLPSGPGLSAVIASALFGSINGSPVANVAGTGAFTIPLMKKSGYEPEYAGAIESAASTGGSLMPPVMGASAFLMATIIGCAYWDIVKVAVVPSILYYFAVGVMVHLHSLKLGMRPAESGPKISRVLREGWHYLVPFVLLVVLLVKGMSAGLCAFYSTVLLVVVVFAREWKRVGNRKGFHDFVIEALEKSAEEGAGIAVALSLLGAGTNTLQLTGLPTRLVQFVVTQSGGHVIYLIILAAAVCFIFGLGMPTVGSYLLAAILLAPALVQLGVPVIAAHLFIYYYTMISGITPPVGVASLVASQISGGSYWGTGIIGTKLVLSSMIVPVVFALEPSLVGLGSGGVSAMIWTLLTVVLSICCFSTGFEGFYPFGKVKQQWARWALIAAGFLLIAPEKLSDAIGLAIFAAVTVLSFVGRGKAKPADLA